jgi:hypothetical protein
MGTKFHSFKDISLEWVPGMSFVVVNILAS